MRLDPLMLLRIGTATFPGLARLASKERSAIAGEGDEMQKSRFSILIATAIIGSCLLAGVARAQEGMGPPPPGMMGGPPPVPPPLMMALRTANPTDDQKKQIHDILESSRKNTASQMEQMRSIRDQIADKLLSSGPVSASDLTPLLAQQSTLQQQLDTQMIATAIQIRGVLTADQLTKMAAAHEKLKQIHSQIDAILGPPDAPPAP
jgi:Spy/CpxP family protein refolding chaperone